jgi:hypothetical protein
LAQTNTARCAHFTSDLCFEPATIVASMAIDRPGAIDAALGFEPERSGGW